MNPNPRIGVLLKIFGASVRLYNRLNPRFGMQGLNRFSREWPEERLLKELPGFGIQTLKEWKQLLARRKRHNVKSSGTAAERVVECNDDGQIS